MRICADKCTIVCYAAVFSVVTQRCVTTLKTAVKQTKCTTELITGFSRKLHFVSSLVSWITFFARFYTLAVPVYLEILKSSDVLKNRMILKRLKWPDLMPLFHIFQLKSRKHNPAKHCVAKLARLEPIR